MPVVAYSKRVVNPDLYNREILMTKDDLRKERGYYNTFLYGSPKEKIAALVMSNAPCVVSSTSFQVLPLGARYY